METLPKRKFIFEFLQQETAGGIMLVCAALVAMVLANSPLFPYYTLLTDTPVEVRIGSFQIAKPMLLWVNDGLMAVFFLLVGLELKREVIEGELSDPRKIVLPAIGAIGGMAVPAGIYLYFNHADDVAVQGWAIPTATDIAFALGVLSLLGSRVPTSLKVFLTSLAIFDDIGAIVIIACFYTSKISLMALIVAAICIGFLFLLNRKGVDETSPYLLFGIVMWAALLKSGVHATLAGVILALFIPIKPQPGSDVSPLKVLEHDLHPAVAFVILPLFAFCNAGVNIVGTHFDQVFHPVTLGIALGLLVGKQIGVFGFCWIGIRLGWAQLPADINLRMLYGASLLCGIGFTMSLFIGSLAFGEAVDSLPFDERVGIIVGSLASGLAGYLLLRLSLKPGTVDEQNPR